MSTENEAVVRRYLDETFNQGNLSSVDETVATDYVNHDPANPVTGTEAVKDLATKYRSAFPDLVIRVDDIFSQGDRVAVRYNWSGTHNGDLGGIAATGRATHGQGILICRMADGKMAEGWLNWDTLGMLQQMGVMTVPE